MTPSADLRVLIVGSGAREHALVRAALASPRCAKVLAAPGNAGIARECTCLPIAADRVEDLARSAADHGINLVLVGPEVPLALGLADHLEARGIPVFGPGAQTARLEASKIFCKEFLVRHRIPTGAARVFDDASAARDYLQGCALPIVVKADGLAAGKGVVVATSQAEALDAAAAMLETGVFGAAGRRILVEECLSGQEASIHVLVADGRYAILPTSQDHKRIGDGDTGPNTGGMGAYSPASWLTDALLVRIEEEIVRPSVHGLVADDLRFRGVLFIGVMVTPSGPKVLEFNVRFGDPETEVLLPRLGGDVLSLLADVASGRLPSGGLAVDPQPAACVVIAAPGYPAEPERGIPIDLPDKTPGVTVFHAGTALDSRGRLVANGGRVLTVAAKAPTLADAVRACYTVCDQVGFDRKQFRRDIAWQELGR